MTQVALRTLRDRVPIAARNSPALKPQVKGRNDYDTGSFQSMDLVREKSIKGRHTEADASGWATHPSSG